MMKGKILIIGAGPAGIEAAFCLAENDYQVCLIEKNHQIGGNILHWVKLFPDFTLADDVRMKLVEKVNHQHIDLKTDTEIVKLSEDRGKWYAQDQKNERYEADAVILSTGFDVFDANRKEELGYGIYNNVVTSVEFEKMTKNGQILTTEGLTPKRIAFLNCVGSRDEKVGNPYCSRVCCINAVKQAIEYKELIADGEAYVFYMDLRMFGQCFEELYRTSQQDFGVQFIRGRISEAAGTIDQRIQIKAEDTLAGLPLKITVDMLVLMVGMEPSHATQRLSAQNGIDGAYGFAKALDLFLSDHRTKKEGLFLAGTCKRPLSIPETLADARAAAIQVMEFVR